MQATSASSSAEQKAYPGREGARSHPRLHGICQKRLEHAVNKSKSLVAETQLVILITAPSCLSLSRCLRAVYAGRHEASWLVNTHAI